MAGLDHQLLNELALGAPIPFPEGVNSVEFTEIVGESGDVLAPVGDIFEEILLMQLGEYGVQLGLDVSTIAERDSFGYLHRSELACPIIDVLEDTAVNGSEVIRIEATFDRIGIQLNHGNQSQPALC